MKYAILGDIHANWPALNVVLDDALREEVSAFASVGDIVGYNPDPVRCIDMVRDMGCTCVLGNHDHFCIRSFGKNDLSQLAAAGVHWARKHLASKHLRYLEGLDKSKIVDGFTLVHATLDSGKKWPYIISAADAAKSFAHQETQVCFCGHTHVPVMFELRDTVTVRHFKRHELDMKNVNTQSSEKVRLDPDTRYLVNTGSVGQPRDRDPRAAYIIFDPDRAELEIRRLPYNIESTRRRIASARLPKWLGARLGLGI